jgi:hypothetical protein
MARFRPVLWLGWSLVLVSMPRCTHPALSFIASQCTGTGGELRSRAVCGHAGFALRRFITGSGPGIAPPQPDPTCLRQVVTSCFMSQQDRTEASAEDFYDKAEQLLREAGGQLDSLAFGRKWKKAHPDENIKKYKGSGVSTIAQLLSLSPRFMVTGRAGSPTKIFALATQDPRAQDSSAGTAKAVEQRQSERGYSFSVIRPSERGSDASIRSSSSAPESKEGPSYADAEAREGPNAFAALPGKGSGDTEGKNGRGKVGGAKKLIDVWSQAATLSEADDTGGQGQQAMAMMRNAGARPDALPYTRLINEHARAAAKGDRSALSRAFQVLDDMQDDGVEPNKITYTALITTCAKAAGTGLGSLAVDRGVLVLEEMVKRGMEIDTITFNALLDACAKAAAGDEVA